MSLRPPMVSFVVLCYNHESFIGECLESIFAQAGEADFEVIVIDDASPDNSADIVSGFSDPRLRFIQHETNQGHIATVTRGLRAARAGIIARIDGDDRYHPEFLATALPILHRMPQIGLLHGDVRLINGSNQLTQIRGARAYIGDHWGNVFTRLLVKNFICAPTVIARREAWLNCLPIPAGLAFHDWYFTLMMSRYWDFYYVDQIVADYRVHAGNMHTAIARNKSEEHSIFRLLDQIYADEEDQPELEAEKRQIRRCVYGTHYKRLGDKYFGFQLNSEARRCYKLALRLQPRYLLDMGLLRHLTATVVGRERYEASKTFIKRLLPAYGSQRG